MDAKKTILVVEDDQSLIEVIKIAFIKSGFSVSIARTVEEALQSLHNLKRVDAIWLDHYLLGDKDGLDFVTKIKRSKGMLARVPIFVVSDVATPDELKHYMKLGVSKSYVKAEHRLEEIISDIETFTNHSIKSGS